MFKLASSFSSDSNVKGCDDDEHKECTGKDSRANGNNDIADTVGDDGSEYADAEGNEDVSFEDDTDFVSTGVDDIGESDLGDAEELTEVTESNDGNDTVEL